MTGATGAAPTGAAPTGATGSASTGATGIQDSRLKGFKAPEKYANEPWAKEVKNVEDLWSKMAGAQKILGKDKVVIPGENATKEELTAFHTKMGRPPNPEGYEFKSLEALKDVKRNVELDHSMKKIFFDEGVPKEVAQRIVTKYEEILYNAQKPMIEAAAKRDVAFQKLSDEVLGEDKVSSMEAFKAVMRESLGDKAHLASKIEGMDNDVLMPLIVLSKNIHDRYTGENRIPGKPGDPPGLSGDLKADFQSLSSQKLAIKTDKKMPEHIKKMKLSNINLQMQKIGVKARDKNIDLFS